MKLHSRNDLMD